MTFELLDHLVAFVPATDLDAARAFYGELLGLEVISADDFSIVVRSGGTDLRITKIESLSPQPFTVLGWSVSDLVGTMTRLAERGVEFLHYEGMNQTDAGLWTAPSGALVSWCRDPDGNTLSLTQST